MNFLIDESINLTDVLKSNFDKVMERNKELSRKEFINDRYLHSRSNQ